MSPTSVGTGEALGQYAAPAAAVGFDQPAWDIRSDVQAPADVDNTMIRSAAIALWLLAHPRADGGADVTLYGIPLPDVAAHAGQQRR